jgi:hypothetical protein
VPYVRRAIEEFSARPTLLVGIAIALLAPTASGAASYHYTGNPFSTLSSLVCAPTDSIEASFTIPQEIPPNQPLTSYAASVSEYSVRGCGVECTTAAPCPDAPELRFEVATDATGAVSAWRAGVVEPGGDPSQGALFTRSTTVDEDFFNSEGADLGRIDDDPGTWLIEPNPTYYVYTGAPFTTISSVMVCEPGARFEAQFALSEALAPNLPLTDLSSSIVSYQVQACNVVCSSETPCPGAPQPVFMAATDAMGEIVTWDAGVVGAIFSAELRTRSTDVTRDFYFIGDIGYLLRVDDMPGTWVDFASPPPLPMTGAGGLLALLVSLGGGAIGRLRARRRG